MLSCFTEFNYLFLITIFVVNFEKPAVVLCIYVLQRLGVWSSLGYDMVFGAVINDEGEDTQHYVDSAFAFTATIFHLKMTEIYL